MSSGARFGLVAVVVLLLSAFVSARGGPATSKILQDAALTFFGIAGGCVIAVTGIFFGRLHTLASAVAFHDHLSEEKKAEIQDSLRACGRELRGNALLVVVLSGVGVGAQVVPTLRLPVICSTAPEFLGTTALCNSITMSAVIMDALALLDSINGIFLIEIEKPEMSSAHRRKSRT